MSTINGTILGVAPIKTSLIVVCSALTILFTVMKPEVTAGLGFFMRLAYWVSHIGVGMLGIILASYIIRVFYSRAAPVVIVIGLTGVTAAILTSPLYYAMDVWFPIANTVDDDWLDTFEKRGWWAAMIAEAIEVMPMLLASWYTVNLPLLFNRPILRYTPPPPDDPQTPDENDALIEQKKRQEVIDNLYHELPGALGTEIVAISSDLHYLNIHTRLGRTLVLGSLRRYVEAFDQDGIQVHRSHWVAKAHITKVHVSGNEAYCLMSTGLSVPISRSKRKQVKEFFDLSTVITKQVASTRLKQVK